MSSIQTAVRIKPIGKNETQTTNMQIIPEAKRIVMGTKAFDCDFVMPTQTSQRNIFEQSCLPVVDSVIDGTKGTILVYGQTGTGKTHTMFGSLEDDSDGIVYQSIQRMFDARDETLSIITLSAMEVYLERVTDLQTSKEVSIRKEFQPEVQWTPIKNISEAKSVINGALQSRHTSATSINERSSRGHVIIGLKLLKPQENRNNHASKDFDCNEDTPIEESQLTLVDLAGSENINRSRVQGRAIQEASSINRSLLALKKIILELSSSVRPAHISYRDSKLTLLIQDSIGGYSRTLLIACVSSAGKDIEETRSTLEYTTKARQIRNLVQSEKERLMTKIKALEFDNQRYKNKFEVLLNEKGCVTLSKIEYEELIEAKAESDSLKKELLAARKRLNSHTNSETYLRVIREVSFAREKEHAEEIQVLRQTNSHLIKSIEELGKTHYVSAMKSISESGYKHSTINFSSSELQKAVKSSLQQNAGFYIQQKLNSYAKETSQALIETTKTIKNQVNVLKESVNADKCSKMKDRSYSIIMDSLKAVMAAVEDTYDQHCDGSNKAIEQAMLEIESTCARNKSIALGMQENIPKVEEAISDLISHYENAFLHSIKSIFNSHRLDIQPIELEMKAFIENIKLLITKNTPEETQLSYLQLQNAPQSRNGSITRDTFKRASIDSQSSNESSSIRSKFPNSFSSNSKVKRKRMSEGK